MNIHTRHICPSYQWQISERIDVSNATKYITGIDWKYGKSCIK